MSQSRQLAAIMFTDIVGYTALMGKDEKKAFELLRKNREIQKPLIKRYNGIWIKELGDGVLASFHTVTDAVFCAAAIHQACNRRTSADSGPVGRSAEVSASDEITCFRRTFEPR